MSKKFQPKKFVDSNGQIVCKIFSPQGLKNKMERLYGPNWYRREDTIKSYGIDQLSELYPELYRYKEL